MHEATLDGKSGREIKLSGKWLLIAQQHMQDHASIFRGEEAIRCDDVTAYTATLQGRDPEVKVYLRGRTEAFEIRMPEPIFSQFKKAVHGE